MSLVHRIEEVDITGSRVWAQRTVRTSHGLLVTLGIVRLASHTVDASLMCSPEFTSAEDSLRPAQASAHLGDVVVVAHEELVVVDIVDVVGVYNTALVSAGQRETVVSGAHVRATRMKSAKTGLGEHRAIDAHVAGGLGDVAGTLLTSTEEASARCLASASPGARAPSRPLGYFAVDGACL